MIARPHTRTDSNDPPNEAGARGVAAPNSGAENATAPESDAATRSRPLDGLRVLYISYNGMLDPLGQSQVLPYLRGLARERGVRFTLLSFERDAAFTPEGEARCASLREQLLARGVEWHRLRYHSRPSLPATAYDVLAGARLAARLVRRGGVHLIHARSHVPAMMALLVKRRLPVRLIFDVRGLMAEEYVEAGHWREGGVPHRLTKRAERGLFAAADGVVTLTEALWQAIRDWEGLRGRAVAHAVVPCCADLGLFRFDDAARARRRAELGLADRFVLAYSGSVGGWYLMGEMADFFAELSRLRPDAHFLWLTRGSHELIRGVMRGRGIEDGRYTIRVAESADVPSYLAACDAGVALIKPGFSKLATSPVKVTEYLACGLPVVLNSGIGDSDELIEGECVGALVRDFTGEEYARAAARLLELATDAGATRERARESAARHFDLGEVGVSRYARLYEEVGGRR